MSAGIYTTKWFLQCFIGQNPFSLTLKLWDTYILEGERVLTAMAYAVLKVHKKRLRKLPLEGLREFLQDTLSRAWALEDDAVLRQLKASMAELHRMQCDLLPPGRPKEFPTRPLGLERPAPAPRPLATPPRIKRLPGPPAQHKPPGPSSSPAITKATEQQHEGATAAGLPLGAPEAPRLACLPTAQDSPQDWLWTRRWNSLPNLPVNHEATGTWPPDINSELEGWVPSPAAPGQATPRAARQAWPCNPTETPATGSAQPAEDSTARPRTLLLPCGNCSQHPSRASDQHGHNGAGTAPQELPQGHARAYNPLTCVSSEKLDTQGPPEDKVTVSTVTPRPQESSDTPCCFMLAFLEDGAPLAQHKSLTQKGLAWPEFGPRGCRRAMSTPPARMMTKGATLASPEFWPKARRALSEPHVASWGLDVPHKDTSVT
ncbi:hypothetical protein J1605_012621 [Eschrichtius robustus]|uniref:Rab-GAP TBC domain-containing protein n=1 Tax=Eschrichtius robustus TaxID=9764 RepID=A0AB34G860_ESCRO|nr:hypothetical protein J1605_001246 [Eschrichtius robustus]KAJ8779418.1 hypothetical protein J1605_012621 [Eschrichtius robustus]